MMQHDSNVHLCKYDLFLAKKKKKKKGLLVKGEIWPWYCLLTIVLHGVAKDLFCFEVGIGDPRQRKTKKRIV
jgi:hypothetical protein